MSNVSYTILTCNNNSLTVTTGLTPDNSIEATKRMAQASINLISSPEYNLPNKKYQVRIATNQSNGNLQVEEAVSEFFENWGDKEIPTEEETIKLMNDLELCKNNYLKNAAWLQTVIKQGVFDIYLQVNQIVDGKQYDSPLPIQEMGLTLNNIEDEQLKTSLQNLKSYILNETPDNHKLWNLFKDVNNATLAVWGMHTVEIFK